MSKPWEISRRRALRGVGVALALPWLEAMRPLSRALAGPEGAAPRRMAFVYMPNGAHMPEWTPSGAGPLEALPSILEPLSDLKREILVLSGLAQDGGFAHGDGGGDHARSLASFLTGTHPVKTDGANIRAGVSVDQVAAQKVGHATKLPSLEIGCDPSAQAGNCDSGYSCAYSSNISWRTPSLPMPKEVNPRLVFDRLFSTPGPEHSRRQRTRKSLLDFVREDADRLQGRLGARDRRKVDEYLTTVRDLEVRMDRAGMEVPPPATASRPEGIPRDYPEHVRLMYDLLALAFQADVTRVATFVLANEASNKSYGFIGVPDGHHDCSHHGGKAEKKEKIRKINAFHVQQFAEFLARLRAIREGDGSLLDHSLIVFGSGISDGDRHDHADLPILLAGRGGGTIRPGRHISYPRKTPLNNLYLAMLDRMHAPTDSLGDGNGRLPQLDG